MRVLLFLLITLIPGLGHATGFRIAALAGYAAGSPGTANGRYCKQSLETVRAVSQPERFLLAFRELRHA